MRNKTEIPTFLYSPNITLVTAACVIYPRFTFGNQTEAMQNWRKNTNNRSLTTCNVLVNWRCAQILTAKLWTVDGDTQKISTPFSITSQNNIQWQKTSVPGCGITPRFTNIVYKPIPSSWLNNMRDASACETHDAVKHQSRLAYSFCQPWGDIWLVSEQFVKFVSERFKWTHNMFCECTWLWVYSQMDNKIA